MPISTLRAKSIPSTTSRKPCTKCWRDCSPSVTTSMPQSSCSLSASTVAWRLASASAAPAARQGGHNRWGSASQAGFGRLPAMVVAKRGMLEAILASGRPPAIEPIVAREQPLAADGGERERAQKRPRYPQLIDDPVAAGGALGARGAPAPLPFVAAHGAGGIVAGVRQPLCEHRRVLDRHGRTLGEIGQHGVGRIPQQGDGALAPTGKGWSVVKRPFLPVLRRGKERARDRRPHRRAVAGEDFRALAGRAPSGLAPVVAYDGNDVDEAAAADRIVPAAPPGADPAIARRRPQFRHQRVGASQGAPGGAAGKARLPPLSEALAQARPQPVSPNERAAAIFEEMLCGAREDRDAVLVEHEIFNPGAEIEDDTGMDKDRAAH